MTPPLGIGIVGCGGAGVAVAEAARSLSAVRVVAVHDLEASLAADLADQLGAVAHEQLAGLLADEAVDAVYIALPHDLLARTVISALESGRHVLVEKPVATSLRDLAAIQAAQARAGKAVGVMLELRRDGAVLAASELVRSGVIGRITSIRIRTIIDKPATYWQSGLSGRSQDPWRASRLRAGGGVVLMNSIHQVDVVRAITGLSAERVSAEVATALAGPGVEVEDVAAVAIRFQGGVVGSLTAAAHAPGAEREEEIEIDGSLGAIRVPDPYGPARPLRVFVREAWRGRAAGQWHSVTPPASQPISDTIEAFAAAIRDQATPVPGLHDAAVALATCLAIAESAQTRRARVVETIPDSAAADVATPNELLEVGHG